MSQMHRVKLSGFLMKHLVLPKGLKFMSLFQGFLVGGHKLLGYTANHTKSKLTLACCSRITSSGQLHSVKGASRFRFFKPSPWLLSSLAFVKSWSRNLSHRVEFRNNGWLNHLMSPKVDQRICAGPVLS